MSPLGRVLISTSVNFNENEFPFKDNHGFLPDKLAISSLSPVDQYSLESFSILENITSKPIKSNSSTTSKENLIGFNFDKVKIMSETQFTTHSNQKHK